MKTSRAQLDRLLDPENQSVTLKTLARAAEILGMRVQIELVDSRAVVEHSDGSDRSTGHRRVRTGLSRKMRGITS
jgi:hypothetical protein